MHLARKAIGLRVVKSLVQERQDGAHSLAVCRHSRRATILSQIIPII